MPAVVRRNERSWAIELITKINQIASGNDLVIKRAGGESTVSTGRGNAMFPDVMLYGNNEQSIILQGWELKMPDVPIEDEAFIKDAQRKATALGLNSCLIWNFTYAVLYVRENEGAFRKVKCWDSTSYIRSREDVQRFRSAWETQLESIILEINGYFASGAFRRVELGDVISNTTITTLIHRNKMLVAENLRDAARHNTVVGAFISEWWSNVKSEYVYDETDRYNAYAKSVILNWANRIIFAHIIKARQNGARLIDEIDYGVTPREANGIFQRITSVCDFYNIFTPLEYDELLPDWTWQDLVEFSLFLKNNGISDLDQRALQNILEGSVNTTKREINGQYTTPSELARILVRLTVRDWSDSFFDCCCGTGTIPKAALGIKREMFSVRQAVESVWACDKYQYPLQVANISMTDTDSVNLANRLFQHNALTLAEGETISITDPAAGSLMRLELPLFGTIASNLPFVPFEIIPEDDKMAVRSLTFAGQLDKRSDLYCYIAVKMHEMLKPGGMLGIITSNSWLGTNTGCKFAETLNTYYNILQVHISGKGRWFQNADVVATILILQKKGDAEPANTQFCLWKKSLNELSDNSEFEESLVNASLLARELDPDIVEIAAYSKEQIGVLIGRNVSYNSLFHKVGWLPAFSDKAIRIDQAYRVFRGSRRGWDAMFYPKNGTHNIEPQYLKRVLINARNIRTLDAHAEADAFCCGKTLEELRALGHNGALEWIERFRDQRNGVGKPLPQALSRTGMQWYELKDNEVAEVFTTMNPGQRLFFARFDRPSFVNQRLIGLCHRSEYSDEELNHALLNSMFTMFYIEAAGFGRGLGVLDINKDSISRCCMLDPRLVSAADRADILQAFDRVKARSIKTVSEELCDDSRLAFEHTVLNAFGMDRYFDNIRDSLLSMQRTRATARETV